MFALVWQLAQPFLFALIGAEINFSVIRPSFVGELIIVPVQWSVAPFSEASTLHVEVAGLLYYTCHLWLLMLGTGMVQVGTGAGMVP